MHASLAIPLALLLAPLAAGAHEFWISPESYTIGAGGQLDAHIRVGERFAGGAWPYLPDRARRFETIHRGRAVPVRSRTGDRPALSEPAPGEGLVVIVHETADSRLAYRDMETFESFLRHKDHAWALEAHAARGLPESGFREVYSRYAKSLVAVGDGAGADAPTGLLTEIVALANPYADDVAGGMPVRVLLEGAPRADAQVELFERAPDGEVEVTLHRTDAEGRALLPVRPGSEYLVDAVTIRAVEPAAARDPVWESLWASLTFLVPAR